MKCVLTPLMGLVVSFVWAGPGEAQEVWPAALSLEQAEELLIRRNLPVAAGKVQVEIAEAARRIAGLPPNPTLQLGSEQVPVWSNIPGSVPRWVSTNGDAGANPTYTAQLTQVIERGHKRQLRVEQASALTDAARAQVLDTIRQQLLLLRQAYTAALLAKANVDLAEEADQDYAETERASEIRFRAGEIAQVDLERIRAARIGYRQAITDVRLTYAQALRDIELLVGMPAGRELQGELKPRPLAPSLEELKALARAERPDVAAAQKLEAASTAGIHLAEAQRKRDLSVAMQYQRVGSDSALGASVSFPLFVFPHQKEAIGQAVAQQRWAALQRRQTQAQVEAEVEKAYLALSAARQSLGYYDSGTVELARRIRETVEYSYQRGEASLLDLLDAQRTSKQTLMNYNQAKAAYETAYWQLVHAVGKSF